MYEERSRFEEGSKERFEEIILSAYVATYATYRKKKRMLPACAATYATRRKIENRGKFIDKQIRIRKGAARSYERMYGDRASSRFPA